MSPRKKSPPDHHAQLVRSLIKHHFGNKTVKVTALTGGITNFVFSAMTGKEELVVRLSDEREKINFFLKEQWAVSRAREKGIPVPDILEVGNSIIPVPYMITRKINGETAIHHTERNNIVQDMGRIAAEIHTIKTTSYGHVFDWSQNTLSRNDNWKDFLKGELQAENRISILQKHKMLPDKVMRKIQQLLKDISNWNNKPCLQHGDLRLKNVMVDKNGNIMAIIDWENCISSISYFWDLSIALHDLSIDKQGYFLEGYGITGKQTVEIAPTLKLFNILNYAPVIDQIWNEKQKGKLEHYKARLQGALDMFSL